MNSSAKLAIAKVLGSLLKAVGFSLIMLMVSLSAITGEFPPDIKRVKNLYGNLGQMQALQSQGPLYINGGDSQPESDVEALESFNKKRATIGAGLLGADTNVAIAGSRHQLPQALPQNESALCLQKVREVEFQLFRLQQRVAELESQK